MRLRKFGWKPAILVLAVCILGSAVLAEETTSGPAQLIQSAMEYVSELDALAVDIDFSMFALVDGEEFKDLMKGKLLLRGDEDLYMSLNLPDSGDQALVEFFNDGDDQVTYIIEEKQYLKEKAEPRMKYLSMRPGGAMRTGAAWFSAFLHNEPAIIEDITAIEDAGQDEEGRHLKLSYEDFDVELWLSKNDPPLLKQFKINPERQYNDLGEEDSVRLEFRFNDWNINPELEDSRFAFAVPEGVEPYKPKRAGDDDMVGKEAPAFKLDLLGGGELDLADHKGKDIVILDFWATWCGPCRIGLPIVAEVAREFADRNVVLYAVNLQESTEQVKTFLDSIKLDLKVPLDKDGKVGRLYGASSIPRMVIVGKDSVIKVAHTGVSPTMKEDLKAELNAILAEE